MNLDKMNEKIAGALDEATKRLFPTELRSHLGASLIGRACNRQLWYGFRWVAKSDFSKEVDGELRDDEPRMKRLFQRGHSEEDRFVTMLREIGCDVQTHDLSLPPDEKGEPRQFKVSGVGGHFGGSLDAIIKLPSWLSANCEMVLGEFKTYGKKQWAKLKAVGDVGRRDRYGNVVKAEHLAQMNVYGYKKNLHLRLYMGTEKDTDELLPRFGFIDHEAGRQLELKAERIIRTQYAPPKLSEDPSSFECKFCDFKTQCHRDALPTEQNCRSCKMAEPRPGPEWFCNRHALTIPNEVIATGCNLWHPITHP